MYFFRKLKPPAFNFETIVGIVFAVIFLFLLVFFSIYVAFGFMSLFFFVYTVILFIVFIRTLNMGYLVLTITIFLDGLFSASLATLGFGGDATLTKIFAFSIIVSTGVLIVMIFNRRLKWRSREMLELAALPVKETSNGFTTRPLPAGNAEFTNDEMYAFARFLHSQLIAIPFYEPDRIVFSISTPLSRQLGVNKDYFDGSWVSFGKNGDVSVMIAQKDYLKYKDTYSFDQLCEQLGAVFVDFLELFKNGEGSRIIDKLNSLRLSPLTE